MLKLSTAQHVERALLVSMPEKGEFNVRPNAGSSVKVLNETVMPMDLLVDGKSTDDEVMETVLANSRLIVQGLNASEHDEIMEELVEGAVKVINSTMTTLNGFIMNTIQFAAEETQTELDKWVSQDQPIAKVHYVGLPVTLTDNSVINAIAGITGNTTGLINITDAERMKLISSLAGVIKSQPVETGIEVLNKFASEYIGKLTDDPAELYSIVEAILEKPSVPDYTSETYVTDINNLVFALIIGLTYGQTPPSGLDMPYSQYQEAIRRIGYDAAIALNSLVRLDEGYRANGRLVVGVRVRNDVRIAYVQTQVMSDFINNHDGCTDAIVGHAAYATAYNNNPLMLDAAVKNLEKLKSSYVRTTNIRRADRAEASNRTGYRILLKHIIEEIKDYDEALLPAPRADVIAKLNERAKSDSVGFSMGRIYDYAREWIVDALYPDSTISKALEYRILARSENPGISIQEANFHAAAEMIADYLAAQISEV